MFRRNPQQARTFCLLLSLFLLLGTGCLNLNSNKITKTAFVLNTVASITVYGNYDEALLDDCFELCRRYEGLFSRTLASSEIYRLNSREISQASPETAQLIDSSLSFARLSGGRFDPTIEPLSALWNFSAESPSVPPDAEIRKAAQAVDYTAVSVEGSTVSFANPDVRLDLGAIAKGYIADRVKELLVSQGVEKAIINLGGNVICIGGKSEKTGFSVGIQYPFQDGSIATVEISDMSVVTSGVYERSFEENGRLYHHILDPETGYPVENGLLSVTIVGASSRDCDALSTACFALGLSEGMKLIESLPEMYGIFITDDYELHCSQGTAQALSLTLNP